MFNKKSHGLLSRWNALFIDREFFMRSNGQVKFITITASLQRRIASIAVIVLALWVLAMGAMVVAQVWMAQSRQSLLAEQAEVADSAERIAAYRGDIDRVAHDLSQRQDMLDTMFEQHFGGEAAALPAAEGEKVDAKIDTNRQKISQAVPEAAPLANLEARQLAFAQRLTRAAVARTARAEEAIRKFGLNPNTLMASAPTTNSAMGGPFIPFLNGDEDEAKKLPQTLVKLNAALVRMDAMERSLLTIPSARPTRLASMTSNFGPRRDPINGSSAMHSGIDFAGPHGTPILAAAGGKVTFAGRKSGYGNTVEITHAGGLMTRYAHMARLDVRPGEAVTQGEKVGAMGSTGRSTGTHLHFEVRLNGRAVNPRPFLEAQSDVLKVQANARRRTIRQSGNEGGTARG